jgi:hypothetical protein
MEPRPHNAVMKKVGTTHPENSNPTRNASSPLIPSRTTCGLVCLCIIGYLVVPFYLRNNAHIQIPALSYQYLIILPIFLFCARALTGTFPKDQPLPRRLLFVTLCSLVLLAGWIGWSAARGLLNPDESGTVSTRVRFTAEESWRSPCRALTPTSLKPR